MTFETEFPELKEQGNKLSFIINQFRNLPTSKDKELQKYFDTQIINTFLNDEMFTHRQIQKHCISKKES